MRTPKISKNAQNSTLSAKKSKKKETIKNVLASPFAKYWPVVSAVERETIKTVLLEYLPLLIPEQFKLPWSELRKVPKKERKAFKESYRKSQLGEGEELPANPKREGIILGINDITKSLENQTAIAVLITKDVRPKVMVEHLIHQSVLIKIPVLIVEGLRDTLKQKTGISSVAIAFTENQKYKAISTQIMNIAKWYPVPDSHINFERSKEHSQSVECITILDDSSIIEVSEPKNRECITILDDTVINEQKLESTTSDKKVESKEIDFTDIYLKKTDPQKRVFTPGEDSVIAVDNSAGFLSFSMNTLSARDRFLQNYLPLKVKRVKADINRNKKKIEKLKQKLLRGNDKKSNNKKKKELKKQGT